MKIRGKSSWAYDTSSGGDISVLIASLQKGSFKLKNLSTRETAELFYGAAGFNQGKSLVPLTLTFATEEMPSTGDVYVSDNVKAPDLEPHDFDGLCFIHGVSVVGFVGVSHTMCFFGIPWRKVPKQLLKGIVYNLIDWRSYLLGPLYQVYKAGKLVLGSSGDLPNIIRPLVGEAKGLIIAKGQAVSPTGLAAGGSVTFGYISSQSDVMPWEVDLPGSLDIHIKDRHTVRDESIITLPGDVLFGFEKDQIGTGGGGLKKAEENLQAIAALVTLMRPRTLFTEGHTDWVGAPQYNQGLSERRANAVKSWLLSKGRLTGVPVTAIGFGLTKPVADNRTAAGREQNRRVEFRILG